MSAATIGFRVDESVKRRLEETAARQHRPLSDLVRDLVFTGMVASAHTQQVAPVCVGAHGQRRPKDNAVSDRRSLPDEVADGLLAAHQQTGASYRQVAAALNIDVAMWWRICQGTRTPSRPVAQRVVDRLQLDDDLAQALLDASVELKQRLSLSTSG
jgi:hypothetical protein